MEDSCGQLKTTAKVAPAALQGIQGGHGHVPRSKGRDGRRRGARFHLQSWVRDKVTHKQKDKGTRVQRRANQA